MAKVDFGHLQRTSVELTEHAIYVLPLSSFTLAYNTFKNYMYFQLSWKKVSVVT